MHNEKTLERIGRASATLIANREGIINRRVESVDFPAATRGYVQRRMSIDFNIPAEDLVAPISGSGDDSLYYLPLSVFEKWPPMRKLDLRDADGVPSPFLTRTQNAVADAALLKQLAVDELGLSSEDDLDPHLARQLARIPRFRSAIAEVVWNELFEYPPEAKDLLYDEQRAQLRESDYFLDMAGGLVDRTVLWMRVKGAPGSRRITKFAYDARISLSGLRGFTPASMGWLPLNFALDVPHIGSSGSYHLQFDIPTQLRVTDARLELRSIDDDREVEERRFHWRHFLLRLSRGDWAPEEADDGNRSPASDDRPALFVKGEPRGSGAHFYISGSRPRAWGSAEVSMMAKKRGFIRGSAIAALLIFGLLVLYTANLDEVLAFGVGSLTMLLLVPGLLGYLVVRPDEHPLATTFLRSFRIVVLVTGLMPVLAAGALIAKGGIETQAAQVTPPVASDTSAAERSSDEPASASAHPRESADSDVSPTLEWLFMVFTVTAGISTVLLILSWIWPPKGMRKPFSDSAPDQSNSFALVDPDTSETYGRYLELSDAIGSARDSERLESLRDAVERADLSGDEHEELSDRIEFLLTAASPR